MIHHVVAVETKVAPAGGRPGWKSDASSRGIRCGISMMTVLALLVVASVPAFANDEEGSGDETGRYSAVGLSAASVSSGLQVPEEVRAVRDARKFRVTSSLTSRQLDRHSDYTLEDALLRMPGIQGGRNGELNIRGAGRNRYNVTLDGHQMATTGTGTREFDLSTISTDMVESVELIRVRTPDMHANALGGTINLNTRQPAGQAREFSVIAGGGANTHYYTFSGPTSRASVSYRDMIRDDLGIAVHLNHQLDHRGFDTFGLDLGVADFGNGPVDVLESYSAGIQSDQSSRLGGSVQLFYQPSEQDTYYLRAFANTNNHDRIRHIDSRNAAGDWINPQTTGAEGELGFYRHDASIQETVSEQYQFSGGGNHALDLMELEYNASWSYGRVDRSAYRFPFDFEEINFNIDMEDREQPFMEITRRVNLVLDDGSINRNFIIGQPFERTLSDYVDHTFSGDFSLRLPLDFGTVSVGSSALLTFNEGTYQETSLENQRILRMERFLMAPQRNIDVLNGDYTLPWLVKTDDARSFVQSQRPSFIIDENLERELSDVRNYEGFEQIYAGFGMITMDFGDLSVLAGVRVEHTASSYDGRVVQFDEVGEHQNTEVTSTSFNYTNLFPNLHVISQHLGADTRLGVSYSRSIARPDFHMLAPFEMTNPATQIRFAGNPELDPMLSDNLDVFIDHIFSDVGQAGVALFYKNLSGYHVETTGVVSGGPFDGWQERTYRNGSEDAGLYGVEVSWQQHLQFLPGFLSNLSTYTNYTWTESTFEPDGRDDEIVLPHQSKHVVNAALNYTQGRFELQMAYHWSDEYLAGYQTERMPAPSVDPQNDVYLDAYEDGWSDLSASFRFRISDNFRFWADASNLLNTERKRYTHNRDLYPLAKDYRDGIGFRAGIRYDL